jgi:hypothetical protein
MAEYIKPVSPNMASDVFLRLVAQTDFAIRYYDLCARHPLILTKSFSCPKEKMVRILSGINQTLRWDSRDKSYHLQTSTGGWVIWSGFGFKDEMVNFAFSAERDGERIGSNYAVIARPAMEAIDPSKIPNPPYPRPCCYSDDELNAVLKECFELSHLLRMSLEKMPKLGGES